VISSLGDYVSFRIYMIGLGTRVMGLGFLFGLILGMFYDCVISGIAFISAQQDIFKVLTTRVTE
jgi:hypothetical protein